MIKINSKFFLDEADLEFSFIRAPGPGGQNVNKVATAVQLRLNLQQAKSIPETIRKRLLLILASKLTQQTELIIKATRFRTQARNKQDAIERLQVLLSRAAIPPKKRIKTKPTSASIQRRLNSKTQHGKIKNLRSKKFED